VFKSGRESHFSPVRPGLALAIPLPRALFALAPLSVLPPTSWPIFWLAFQDAQFFQPVADINAASTSSSVMPFSSICSLASSEI
jgi:hypothetical protein